MAQLIPQTLYRTYKTINQDTVSVDSDIFIRCKLFDPCSGRTWYISEYDHTTNIAFGYVVGPESERGYFSIDELQSYRGPLGLGIERDLYFNPVPFSQLDL